jgi:hypothetical protein
VQFLEDPGFRLLNTATVPDEIDLCVEPVRQLPAEGFGHDLTFQLVVLAARLGVAGIFGEDLLPPVAYAFHEHIAGQLYLDVAAHDHLGRVVKEDERQAGMADRSPDEEFPGLVELDRHHLQALQVVQAQHIPSLDKVLCHFHRCPVSRADGQAFFCRPLSSPQCP